MWNIYNSSNVSILYYYIYVSIILIIEINFRKRLRQLPKLSEEEVESRILLQKEWTRYKTQQYLNNVQIIDSIFYSQQKALDELRAESEQLYQEAIHVIILFI